MPELPEVETTVRDLKKVILGRKIEDVWSDSLRMIRLRSDFGKKEVFDTFKKQVKGKKIEKILRRGKNILFYLSGDKVLLIHQKLTGHLLVGKWKFKKGKWESQTKGPLLKDPMNRFLHLVFLLDNKKQLALSDLRKFAKAELWDREEFENSINLGPEPLEITLEEFKNCLKGKKGKIKKVLMDQTIIAGIGNIYSDEILWRVKIHPFKDVSSLTKREKEKIYKTIKEVLRIAIKAKGESFSDFRRISGEKGNFDDYREVYRRTGEKCSRCKAIIERVKMGGRSAHYCPRCQKL